MFSLGRMDSLCKKQGVSRSYVCREIGVNVGFFSDVKRGMIVVSEEKLGKIASVLNTTIEYLTCESDEIRPNFDMEEYLNYLKGRPEMKMLFSVAKDCTKEDIERAVTIIEALKKNG